MEHAERSPRIRYNRLLLNSIVEEFNMKLPVGKKKARGTVSNKVLKVFWTWPYTVLCNYEEQSD